MESSSSWMLTGFQVVASLGVWAFVVVAHAVWRALGGAETDPIRESGPIA